jgi:hypothetical protein
MAMLRSWRIANADAPLSQPSQLAFPIATTMQRPFATLITLLALCLALPAEDLAKPTAEDVAKPTAADNTVIPGKRVGLITQYASLGTLRSIYGSGKVRCCKLDAGEGMVVAGAKLFEGTDRALDIVWDEKGIEKRIADVRILGRAWAFPCGLKLGMTLAEVQKMNGAQFKVSGFGWTYGGYATFEGGKFAGGVTVRFRPTEQNYSADARGNVRLVSDCAAMESAHAVVESIIITFFSEGSR